MENTATRNFLHNVLSLQLVDYLKDLGLEQLPNMSALANFKGFKSPFVPQESGLEAMLFVDPVNQQWFCPNSHTMGNIIDFGTRFHHCSVPELLDKFKIAYPFQNKVAKHPQGFKPEHYHQLESKGYSLITDPGLRELIKANHLSMDMMNHYCSQHLVKDRLHPGQFYALAFKAGGTPTHFIIPADNDSKVPAFKFMELTNGSAYSLRHYGKPKIEVYVSLMDLLHARQRFGPDFEKNNNILLLSDIYAFEKARPLLERHEQVNLYLPNDPIAEQYKGYAAWLSPIYKDFSVWYKDALNITEKCALPASQRQEHHKKLGL